MAWIGTVRLDQIGQNIEAYMSLVVICIISAVDSCLGSLVKVLHELLTIQNLCPVIFCVVAFQHRSCNHSMGFAQAHNQQIEGHYGSKNCMYMPGSVNQATTRELEMWALTRCSSLGGEFRETITRLHGNKAEQSY